MDEIKLTQEMFLVVRDGVFMNPEFVCSTLDSAIRVVGVLTARALRQCSDSAYRVVKVSQVAP